MIRMICSQEISLFVTVSSMLFSISETDKQLDAQEGVPEHMAISKRMCKIQNYEQTYKHNTTHIFRIPVEAYYLKWEQGS